MDFVPAHYLFTNYGQADKIGLEFLQQLFEAIKFFKLYMLRLKFEL